MARRPLRLVPPYISEATIHECQDLLDAAKRGDLVGIAFIAIGKREYHVNAVGQASERPTLTRGMIRVLDDLLRDRMKSS
jgi:hypothetical protein